MVSGAPTLYRCTQETPSNSKRYTAPPGLPGELWSGALTASQPSFSASALPKRSPGAVSTPINFCCCTQEAPSKVNTYTAPALTPKESCIGAPTKRVLSLIASALPNCDSKSGSLGRRIVCCCQVALEKRYTTPSFCAPTLAYGAPAAVYDPLVATVAPRYASIRGVDVPRRACCVHDPALRVNT